jgi:hypothetical protein
MRSPIISEAYVKKIIIFVPYWIESVLKRNNFTLRDVINYDVVRRVVSLKDLSQMLSFQNLPGIGGLQLAPSSSLLNKWETSAGRNRAELDSTVVPMSYSNEKEALERLTKTGLDSIDESDLKYKISDIERDITAIVLYPGFMEECKNNSFVFNLVRELLKVSYVYCRVEDVSASHLYKTYIDLLEVSTL